LLVERHCQKAEKIDQRLEENVFKIYVQISRYKGFISRMYKDLKPIVKRWITMHKKIQKGTSPKKMQNEKIFNTINH
jgi:hypothetical protein